MNKILTIGVFAISIIAVLTASLEEDQRKELDSYSNSVVSRELRDADLNSKRNKNKKNPSRGKGNRRNKKNHKKVKKNGRQQNKKHERKQGVRTERDGDCNEASCLANVVQYMSQLKDKVKNFQTQRKRIMDFNRFAQNKADKKEIFSSVLFRVTSTGGGDATALTCAGEKDTEGATAIQDLADKLATCSEEIEAKCVTAKPEIDESKIEECNSKMETFKAAVDKCKNIEEDADKCECWNADDIKMASDDIRACDISTLSKDVATFKKKCVRKFVKCRQLEDSANDVLFECNPVNNMNNMNSTMAATTMDVTTGSGGNTTMIF